MSVGAEVSLPDPGRPSTPPGTPALSLREQGKHVLASENRLQAQTSLLGSSQVCRAKFLRKVFPSAILNVLHTGELTFLFPANPLASDFFY